MNERLPRIAVVVPTYWTRSGGASRPGDAVYDHPTPTDEEGTLGRLLQSLTTLDTSSFYVLVLVAVTDSSVETAACRRVAEIVSESGSLSVLTVSGPDLALILSELADPLAPHLLGLAGYSAVRNLQLAVPLSLGSESIVALDDDEVVTDPLFLERATSRLGSTVDGRRVDGSSGFYLQDESGRILLEEQPGSQEAENVFDRKASIMNSATRMLEEMPGSMVPTPFCFGGNMIFSSELAASVCFDPSITRGEDIDYLINARLAGRWYFMNKELRILHLPPAGGSYRDVAYHKVIQDVLRFVYERQKLLRWREIAATVQVTARDLWPYPGEFLDDRLDGDAREVVERIVRVTSAEQRQTFGLGDSVDAFMTAAYDRAEGGVDRYRSVQDAWRRTTAGLAENRDIRNYLLNRVRLEKRQQTAGHA